MLIVTFFYSFAERKMHLWEIAETELVTSRVVNHKKRTKSYVHKNILMIKTKVDKNIFDDDFC